MGAEDSKIKINKNGIFYINDDSWNSNRNLNDNCGICLGIPVRSQITPCGHVFCLDCLNDWMSHTLYEKTCPICRHHFDLFEIQHYIIKGSSQYHKKMPHRCGINTHRRQFGTVLLYEEKIDHLNFRATLVLSFFICTCCILIAYLL